MNLKKRKAYLHIGRHKTGSGAIQHFLFKNIVKLDEANFRVVQRRDYSDLSPLLNYHKSVETNLFDLGNAFIRSNLINGIRARGVMPSVPEASRPNLAKDINSRLHSLSGGALILSAEAFSFMRYDNEKDNINILFEGLDLHVLLIERESRSWIKSYMAQTQWLQRNFPHLINQQDSVFDFSLEGWQLNLSGLKSVFNGPDLLQYEDLLNIDGSVIPAFIRWLGRDPEDFHHDLGFWSNRSSEK